MDMDTDTLEMTPQGRTARSAERNEPRVSAWFEALLPDGVVATEILGEGDPAALPEAEQLVVGPVAGSRAREFAAGRTCARLATERLGAKPSALARGYDRVPLWPGTVTGSITHTPGYAAAAVGPRRRFRAIGIDAERIGGVTRDLWRQVFLPDEILWLSGLPPASQAQGATLLFSAKETFYKCQFEVTGQWLEFQDVLVLAAGADVGRGALDVRPVGATPLKRIPVVRYRAVGDLMLTATVITAR